MTDVPSAPSAPAIPPGAAWGAANTGVQAAAAKAEANAQQVSSSAGPTAKEAATGVPLGDGPPGQDGAPSYASASLYIGDLHHDVTEPVLYEVFSQPASVASIRICRDSQTQRSLGYGYVNYHTIPDAERAMDVLNFTHIKGRPCRIMWANRDKTTRMKFENNVFVKNLDRNIDNKSLYDTFSLFGQIVSCKVATDSNGKSLGYGYVQYEKEQSLVDAIKRVNGMQIGKNTVYCGRHKRKEDRESLREQKFTNVYVKGYDHKVITEEQLLNIFGHVGKVTSHYQKSDDKGRHCLFVNFESFEAARESISRFNNLRFKSNTSYELMTRAETEEADLKDEQAKEAGTYPEDAETPLRLYCARQQSRAERDELLRNDFAPKPVSEPQPTVLYARHFPMIFDEEELKGLFEPYGIVTVCKIARDESNGSRGFGFVTMPDAQDAQKAITGLHETSVGAEGPGGSPKLYVAYLEPKETRQARLKAQIAENMWRPTATFRPQVGAAGPAVNPGATMTRGTTSQGARPFNRNTPNSIPAPVIDASIAQLGFKEQKQAIGDKLYHHIMNRQPALAGKITGMMLEMPNEDLLRLLKTPDELTVKIDEAIDVLKAAGSSMPK